MGKQVVPSGVAGDMFMHAYDSDASGTVDDTEAVNGTDAADIATDAEVTASVAAHNASVAHPDIATNTAARHTQGTDDRLDGGGANQVTAVQAKAAVAHVISDGSDHTFIDQDVTSGSSPVLDGSNFTGLPQTGPTLYDIVGDDWINDAAAGGGGEWDFLVDGLTTPSGWSLTGATTWISVAKIDASGHLIYTATRAGTDFGNTFAKTITSDITLDPSLWPSVRWSGKIDASGNTGVADYYYLNLYLRKPTSAKMIGAQIIRNSGQWQVNVFNTAAWTNQSGSDWRIADLDFLFEASPGSITMQTDRSGSWAADVEHTAPLIWQPSTPELKVEVGFAIYLANQTADWEIHELDLVIY